MRVMLLVLILVLFSSVGRSQPSGPRSLPLYNTGTLETFPKETLESLSAILHSPESTGPTELLRSPAELDKVEKILVNQNHAMLTYEDRAATADGIDPDSLKAPCDPERSVYAYANPDDFHPLVHGRTTQVFVEMAVAQEDVARIERLMPKATVHTKIALLDALARIPNKQAMTLASRYVGDLCSDYIAYQARLTVCILAGCASDKDALEALMASWDIKGKSAEYFRHQVKLSERPKVTGSFSGR